MNRNGQSESMVQSIILFIYIFIFINRYRYININGYEGFTIYILLHIIDNLYFYKN